MTMSTLFLSAWFSCGLEGPSQQGVSAFVRRNTFKLLKLKFDMIIKLMIDGQLENIKRQLEALGFHSC